MAKGLRMSLISFASGLPLAIFLVYLVGLASWQYWASFVLWCVSNYGFSIYVRYDERRKHGLECES